MMYCSNCGASNKSDALYCEACGSRLDVDNTKSSGGLTGEGGTSFAEAVRKVLVILSPDALREPQLFFSGLKDICDPSSQALLVLENNCDKELLAPFIEEMDTARWGSFENAAARAIGVLSGPKGRGVDQSIATEICGAICAALNELYGLSNYKTGHAVGNSKASTSATAHINRGVRNSSSRGAMPAQPIMPSNDYQHIDARQKHKGGARIAVAVLSILAIAFLAIVVVLLLPKEQDTANSTNGADSTTSIGREDSDGSSIKPNGDTEVNDDSVTGLSNEPENGGTSNGDEDSDSGSGLSSGSDILSTNYDGELEKKVTEFPREWQGTFVGYSSDTKSHEVTNGVEMTFTQVRSDGSVEGTCTIIVNRAIADKGNDSYRIKGIIDWNTNAIDVWGYDWIYQGDSEYMRRFSGTYDESVGQIVGMTEVKDTGGRVGEWNMQVL